MLRRCYRCAVLAVLLVVVGAASPAADKDDNGPSLQFPDKIVLQAGTPNRLSGRHNLAEDSRVLFLVRDRFGNNYLQWPRVTTTGQRWSHANVLPGDTNITELIAITVDSKGLATVETWVRSRRFGAIADSEIEDLSGYKKVGFTLVEVKDAK